LIFIVAPLALDDLDEIHRHVEELVGTGPADRLVEDLFGAFRTIALSPGLGHRRRDLTDLDVFFWTAIERYAVVYRKADPMEIVRVLPWRRMRRSLVDPRGGPTT
jgi:plasmid stabilization system protein ParE